MKASEFHSSRKFAETQFGRVAYVERGTGPAALFVHALPLCGYQWRAALDELAALRTCIAPDLMGLGYTEVREGQDLSFEAQAQALAAFLERRAIGPVDLVGNDTGGGVSQIFAARYPNQVRTLTLTNCEVSDLWPNAMLKQFYAALQAGMVAETFKVMARDQGTAQAQLASVYEHPEALDLELLEAYFGPFADSAYRRELVKGFAAADRNRDQIVAVAPQLRASRIPSQVLWGEADTAFDGPASLKWLRDNLGGLRKVTTVPHAKLFWPEEHPRLLTVLLKEFWASAN